MVQIAKWAGPLNFGVHFCFRTPMYVDIHLPYIVVILGNVHEVEYPPWWWACAKDASTGVKYADNNR